MLQRIVGPGVWLAVAALLAWGGLVWLAPLAALPANTKALVATTGEILAETRQLQAGVEAVHQNLAQMQVQEALLAEQAGRMEAVTAALQEQEQLASRAGELLAATLEEEWRAAALTARASEAARATQDVLDRNAGVLWALSAETDRVQAASRTIDGQVQELVIVMEGAKENFAVVGRLKEAAASVGDRTGSFLDRLLDRLRGWFSW